ncbi:MAG: AlpA family transcriptional regulator [Prevotella sp.]|nr:AlpA family transcriptional regulator [Prevotella sp.]
MKLLKLKDVMAMTALSKPSIYRQLKAGTFPVPIRLGPRAVAWILSEIEEWVESKKSLR